MNVFAAGTDVTLAVPLTDASGNVLAIDAITYTVTDQDGVVLVAATALEEFTPGAETADIVVPAASNVLGAGVGRALRSIQLACVIGANTVQIHDAYAISVPDPLVVGANSFASYITIQFTALSIPNLAAWDKAGQLERMAALIEARERICRLSFTGLGVSPAQDSIDFIPEGSYDTPYPGRAFQGEAGLEMLTPAQFHALPIRFVTALTRAQLVEADNILNGDSVEQRRVDGLVQDDVGESRQVYRDGKPLQLPVCRRALSYLSLYISFAKKIGRA